MKLQWFRSATVGIHSRSGTSVLCDPWLTDGAFLGSWFHFPPLKGNEFADVLGKEWDAVYVSHLHADHFDRKFLAALAKSQPGCKVIIPSFAHDWLRRAVANCGFEDNRLIQVDSGHYVFVGDMKIKVVTADHCDPQICGVSLPCHKGDPRIASIDSLALFEADGQTILNANDALAVASVPRALAEIGSVDLLLGHFGGAGPFPQCFSDISPKVKLEKANAMANSFLTRLARAATLTNAKFLMPFAGQYMLGGRLAHLNKFRSLVSLDEAVKILTAKSDCNVIAIEPFSEFDLDGGIASKTWVEPSNEEVESYLKKLSTKKFPYEKAQTTWEEADQELEEALHNVAKEYLRRRAAGRVYNPHRVSLYTSTVSGFVDFEDDQTQVFIGELPPMIGNETRLTCNPSLLRGLIRRSEGYSGFTPMHFNQAELGSHFEWRRKGDYNDVIECLNFLQATRRGSSSNLHLESIS